MRCPKCQYDHALQTTECLKCGIVFARYRPAPEATTKPAVPSVAATLPAPSDAFRELKYRIFALPLALLVARLVAGSGLRFAAGMLAMVLHESGHALTAWLTGRWAVPLLWVTPHGEERSWSIVLILTAAILLGGFLALGVGYCRWRGARRARGRAILAGGSSDRFFRRWRCNGAGHNSDGGVLRSARKRGVPELGLALGLAFHRSAQLHARFPPMDGTV